MRRQLKRSLRKHEYLWKLVGTDLMLVVSMLGIIFASGLAISLRTRVILLVGTALTVPIGAGVKWLVRRLRAGKTLPRVSGYESVNRGGAWRPPAGLKPRSGDVTLRIALRKYQELFAELVQAIRRQDPRFVKKMEAKSRELGDGQANPHDPRDTRDELREPAVQMPKLRGELIVVKLGLRYVRRLLVFVKLSCHSLA